MKLNQSGLIVRSINIKYVLSCSRYAFQNFDVLMFSGLHNCYSMIVWNETELYSAFFSEIFDEGDRVLMRLRAAYALVHALL